MQVIGSAAMLGGVTRMTISITLLAMEGTGSLQLIIPLMLAVFAAKIAGDSLTLPIYDIQIKIRGAPVLVSACVVVTSLAAPVACSQARTASHMRAGWCKHPLHFSSASSHAAGC